MCVLELNSVVQIIVISSLLVSQLSPSLRNRFVEIWCPSTTSRGSFERIISHNLRDDIEPPPTGEIH